MYGCLNIPNNLLLHVVIVESFLIPISTRTSSLPNFPTNDGQSNLKNLFEDFIAVFLFPPVIEPSSDRHLHKFYPHRVTNGFPNIFSCIIFHKDRLHRLVAMVSTT